MQLILDTVDWDKNVKRALKDKAELEKLDKRLETEAKKVAKAQQQVNAALDKGDNVLRALLPRFRQFGDRIRQSAKDSETAARGLSRFTERLIQLDAGIRIVDRLARSLNNISQGLEELERRAVQVRAIGASFEIIAGGSSKAEQSLAGLREQAQGAISDTELMRLTNLALMGSLDQSTGQLNALGQVIQDNYGRLIPAAMAVATARGQDWQVVLEKFTRGVRLQRNALVDDLGVFVETREAQQRWAEATGISVAAMTEEQKAAAWAADAFRQLSIIQAQAGELAVTESQRAAAAWENAMDRIALTTQSGTASINNAFARARTGVAEFYNQSAPYLGAFADVAGRAINQVLDDVNSLAGGLDPDQFYMGGANVIAALAEGMLSGLTTVVQVLNVITGTISNWLMGFSPPKEGPLSSIDVGGQKVVEAWMGAFQRVSLGPVQDLAQEVNDILTGTSTLAARDQAQVIELTQKRLGDRLKAAIAALSRGEIGAGEVRILQDQYGLLSDQLELARERATLEQIGLKAQADQLKLAQDMLQSQQGTTDAAKAGGKADKDALQALRDKLDLNRRLQAQYTAQGAVSSWSIRWRNAFWK